MNSFKELKLHSALERALEALHFDKPTPIQAQAIQPATEGKDIIACAQTGTGKTAAFSIPIATHMLQSQDIIGLILAPTRELALQIELFWKNLTKFSPELRSACLIGGVSMQPQDRALHKRPRLIIATPGRLLDHLRRGSVKLAHCERLVLDEADRMLDMGFAPQLNQILKFLPKKRQTLLFSATWDPNLDRLAKNYLVNPIRISVGPISQAAKAIDQSVIMISNNKKSEALIDEINKREGSILVFARTQSRTDRLARYLNSYGLEVGRIHGGRSQGQRTTAMNGFRSGEIRVLLATDIASRGIDVAEIAHVINFDLPQLPEDYVHRIGRTGRAGQSGKALSFVTPEDRSQWNSITRLLKQSGSAAPTVTHADPKAEHKLPQQTVHTAPKPHSAPRPVVRPAASPSHRTPHHAPSHRPAHKPAHAGAHASHRPSQGQGHAKPHHPHSRPHPVQKKENNLAKNSHAH